jgi:tetratricopeptide (TPR) repeat protein
MHEETPLRFGPRTGQGNLSSTPASSNVHSFFGRGEGKNSSDEVRPEGSSSRASWIVTFLDRMATTSLFMIFFGFPLFFLSMTLQGLVFEKQMFFYFWLLLGLIGWVSKGIVTGELRIRHTPLDIPILLVWATVGISCFFSVDKWHSLWGFFGDPSRGFLNVTALTLAYFFITSHVTVRRFQFLLGAILLSGTLVAMWTALAFFGIRFLPEALLKYAPLSLFGTMKSLTLFFGMLLPLFLLGFVTIFQWFKEKNWAFWALLGTLSLGLLLDLYILLAVYAFTPWFPVLVGVSFFLIYVLAQVVRLGDRFNWMPMALFVVVLVCLMIGNQGNAFLSKKTTILPEVALDQSSSWTVAKEALKERMIVGSGPATYGYNFSLHKPDSLNAGLQNNFRFYQGGNFFFELVPTVGVVGGFFFLILLLTYLGLGLVSLSREKERNKIFSLGIWASSFIFVAALFRTPIEGPTFIYGTLLMALAVPVLLEEGGRGGDMIRLSLKASPKFALALAFTFMTVSAGVAFLFAFVGKAFLADIHAGRASRMAATEVNDEALGLMARSLSLFPYEGRYYATLGQMYMSVVNKEAAKPEGERNLDLIKTTVERSAVPLVDEAMRRMPNDAFIHEVSGQVYENVSLLAGSDPEVLARTGNVYRRALDLEPKNPSFYVKLGLINRVLANRDDKKSVRSDLLNEAKEYFTTAIERKPDFIAGYLNRGLTEEALGNTGGAVNDLEKALKIGPNADVQFHLARILQVRGAGDDLNRAERVSLDALKRNDKSINVLLNLGFVYEKQKNKDKAIETYRKLLAVFDAPSSSEDGKKDIPETSRVLGESDQYAEVRKQVQTLIDNVESGKGNLSPTPPALSETPASTPTEIPAEARNDSTAPAVLPAPVSPATTPELPGLPETPRP